MAFTPIPHANVPVIDPKSGLMTRAWYDALVQLDGIGPSSVAVPTGTVMLFFQANAPTGWTKLTTHNDKALRIVSGAGGGSGGTNSFSTVMAQTTVGGTALSIANLPAHTHSTVGFTLANLEAAVSNPVDVLVGSGSTSTGSQGSGTAHNHSITMAVQFIDLILASKD